MTDVVSVLKKAKELFVTHPEYWGMCFCIEHAMAGTERGITIYSQRDIITMIPEFNRKFLNAPKDRYGKAYWWTPDSEEGHNARVKAFDKLIKYYELDKKNRIYVNGKLISEVNNDSVHISFTGNVKELNCNTCDIDGNALTVHGNSVKVKGNVGGSIEANSIEVGGDVEGDITANSVKVRGKHTGSISM